MITICVPVRHKHLIGDDPWIEIPSKKAISVEDVIVELEKRYPELVKELFEDNLKRCRDGLAMLNDATQEIIYPRDSVKPNTTIYFVKEG